MAEPMTRKELLAALREGRRQQVIAQRMTTAIMERCCAVYPDIKAIEQATLQLRQQVEASIIHADIIIARVKAEPEPWLDGDAIATNLVSGQWAVAVAWEGYKVAGLKEVPVRVVVYPREVPE